MNIFISGITGTLGQAVSKALLENPNNHIIGYSRDEKKQSEIKPHDRLTLFLGDVRDQRRLIESTRNCDMILHFAALKRVDAMENNPEECIQTNVEGTINILGAQRANKIRRVVLSSTDKACKPINVYGYCKALSEKLVLRNKNNVVVRYGNVLASRGSAIPGFIEAIKKSNSVDITDIEMTRFFIRIEDAAKYVIRASMNEPGGLKILREMGAVYIKDVIECIAEILGKPKPTINVVGLRPGEKIHEDLYHEFELSPIMPLNSFNARHFTRQELTALLEPIVLGHT